MRRDESVKSLLRSNAGADSLRDLYASNISLGISIFTFKYDREHTESEAIGGRQAEGRNAAATEAEKRAKNYEIGGGQDHQAAGGGGEEGKV